MNVLKLAAAVALMCAGAGAIAGSPSKAPTAGIDAAARGVRDVGGARRADPDSVLAGGAAANLGSHRAPLPTVCDISPGTYGCPLYCTYNPTAASCAPAVPPPADPGPAPTAPAGGAEGGDSPPPAGGGSESGAPGDSGGGNPPPDDGASPPAGGGDAGIPPSGGAGAGNDGAQSPSGGGSEPPPPPPPPPQEPGTCACPPGWWVDSGGTVCINPMNQGEMVWCEITPDGNWW